MRVESNQTFNGHEFLHLDQDGTSVFKVDGEVVDGMTFYRQLAEAAIEDGKAAVRPSFGVWCTVSGGVTGDRQAWLRNDGATMRFATRDAAETQAASLRKLTANHSGATFTYEARPLCERTISEVAADKTWRF